MEKTPDMQTRLQSLSISGEKRPKVRTRSHSGRGRLVLPVVVLVALGVWGYLARDRIVPFARDLAARTGRLPQVELITTTSTEPLLSGPVLTATGKIVSDHTVSVATKVSGQIVSLHFEQGDTVEQGQLLATIEDVLYRARRDEAAAHLARSKANLKYQRVNFERVARLMRSDNAPKIEYADAKRALDEAIAQIDADKASLVFAQKTLDDCRVVAPIGGVVLQRNVEVGDFVAAEGGIGANANARFAVVADMRKLRVEVDISELDITRIQEGLRCTVTPDAYKDRRYDGYVLWLDPGANYSKATVQAKVRIENPDEYLRVDGSAQVAFLPKAIENQPQGQTPEGIWIPASAVKKNDAGESFVFLEQSGRLRKVTVEVAESRGEHRRVVSGLIAGQRIARSNDQSLRDGMALAAPTAP